jgi:hypothetical protein
MISAEQFESHKESAVMNNKTIFGTLLAVFLLHAPAEEAAAQSSFYKMAKRTSSTLVSSSWNSLGKDCHKADNLVQIIGDAVDRVTRDLRAKKFKGQMAVDFGNGYIDGLVSTLDDVVNQCSNECSIIGNASGKWSSEIFCAVSEVIGTPAKFDGLVDRPNIVCGEAYRMSCESTFVGQCNKVCPQYNKGKNFDSYYPASRGGCCSYDVKD